MQNSAQIIHSSIVNTTAANNLLKMRKNTINIQLFITNCFKYSAVLIPLFELINNKKEIKD